ncbi:glycine cleavage system H protein-like protein [Hypoxylon cercidicola]|nr:glycine cleavage system H protein-like protein [Hypoxylon cercidicola]
MASIARCLRSARPSTLSRLAQKPCVRSNWQPASLRAFSASPIRDIRRYTKDHEWIDLNADKTTGVIGISEYAAEELGDVVYVELPEEGKEVTGINLALEEKPGTINQVPEDDSHGGGWIAKVQVDEQGAKDFDALMDLEEYKAFTGSEHH